jgi:hypothetical protein
MKIRGLFCLVREGDSDGVSNFFGVFYKQDAPMERNFF